MVSILIGGLCVWAVCKAAFVKEGTGEGGWALGGLESEKVQSLVTWKLTRIRNVYLFIGYLLCPYCPHISALRHEPHVPSLGFQ